MVMPCGRYKWNRLSFGLKVSSEYFPKHLANALTGLQGILAVANLIVFGCGDSHQAAEADHEHNKLREQ